MGIFKKLFGSNKVKAVSTDSTVFDDLKYVETLCNTSIDIQKKKLEEEKRLVKALETLEDCNKYKDINEADLNKLEDLLERYKTLRKEKETLKSDLLLNEKKYEGFKKYEKDMDNIIKEMQELEEKKDHFDTDIRYLKAEQNALKYEDDTIDDRKKIINRLFYAALFFLCLASIAFSVIYFVYEIDIVMPVSITAVVVIFWLAWVYMYELDLKQEFKKNKGRQEKAVKTINKAKIKLVNVEADLDYIKKKYRVQSSEALKNKWAIYKQTKNKRFQYNEVFNDYFEVYDEIETLLLKYGISFENDSTVIKEISEKKEKIKMKETAEKMIENCKDKITEYDEKQNEIIAKLKVLRENDDTLEQSVSNVITSYLRQIEGGKAK